MRVSSVLVPVLGVMLAWAPVQAQDNDDVASPEKMRSHRMWQDLGLTEDQKAKLKELHKEVQQIHRSQMEKAKAVREEMKKELLNANPSQRALQQFARQLGDLHREGAEKRTDHLLKVKQIMTPEQFAKVVEKDCGVARHGMKAGCGNKRPGKHGMKDGCSVKDGKKGPGCCATPEKGSEIQ